mmetsp:Transcript_9428/g.18138  ORF Transcript_9428/g.18138 Transcript_9428/m.18138 type:complete len:289 (-) Transcript_9428:5564-6430(-)
MTKVPSRPKYNYIYFIKNPGNATLAAKAREDYRANPAATRMRPLFRVINLSTGDETLFAIHTLNAIPEQSSWVETSTRKLYFTGGGSGSRNVASIDVARDFSISYQRPLITGRVDHAVAYFRSFLYVVGGFTSTTVLDLCERLDTSQPHPCDWERVPSLDVPLRDVRAVALEQTQSLYILGGKSAHGSLIDLIQELNLVSMTWRTLAITLPFQSSGALPFLSKSAPNQINFIQGKGVYSLDPAKTSIAHVSSLEAAIERNWRAQPYLWRGTLYFSDESEYFQDFVGLY